MAATKPLKILVTGDVDGKFNELFTRINTVNKKNGPFDMLLCAGNFFSIGGDGDPSEEQVAALLDSIPPISIPTYILGPTSPSQMKYYSDLGGCEIKPNITYLGHSGLYTESSGLRVVYLSGVEQKEKGAAKREHEFDEDDIRKLQLQLSNTQNQQGIDILMTSQWPNFVWEHAPGKPTAQPKSPSLLLSSLASLLRPRYHFCGMEGLNYERAPYRNHQVLAEPARHVTRFIALGKVGNPTKTKWLYACTVMPMIHMAQTDLVVNPPDATENPYTGKLLHIQKPESNQQSEKSQQFFYDDTYTGEDYNYRGRGRGRGRGGGRGSWRGGGQKREYDNQRGGHHQGPDGKRQFQERAPPTPCWFCLASPQVEKHLIISIGDTVYLTLAKGGLTPEHVLILPIGHFQSTVECQDEVLDEINKFKQALCKFFFSRQQVVVFYERNFRSPHLQIQCIPLPLDKFGGSIPKLNTLMSHCQDYSESESIDLQHVPSNVQIFQLARPGFPYFFMEIFSPMPKSDEGGADEDGEKRPSVIVNKLFAPIQRGQQFPLQFGRELLGSEAILNLRDRIDWRQCKESQEEQTKWTQDFRNNFKAYDFTLA